MTARLRSLASRDRVLIAVAYTIAWGALLVNRGLYWDDWTLTGRSVGDLVGGFTELGLPLGGLAYGALFSLPLPGLVGHILVFAAYLASALLLHAILRRLPGLSRMDALIAALTFALLPVNYARIALIDSMYALSLLAFLAATWLLIRFVADGGTGRRIASLVLFLLSFYTASMLVLYLVPMALAAALLVRSDRRLDRRLDLRLAARHVARHADFLALPVAYWLVKGAFLTPTGVYEGYNELSLGGLLEVPRAMLAVPFQVLVEPLGRAIAVAGVVGVVAGLGVAVWLVRRIRATEDGRFVPAPILALIGIVIVVLGVFAYLAVGLTPTIWDWSSRHQLLVPLGVGLIAAATARGIASLGPVGRGAGVAVVGVLLGISAVANVRTLVAYQVDWFKEQAIIATVRASPDLHAARHIQVVDAAAGLNALRRTYRFYELNAMFERATGTQDRLVALRGRDVAAGDVQRFVARRMYHMTGYVASPVDLELRIATERAPHLLDVLRLVALEAIGSPSFETEVSRLIDLSATRPTAAP
jgi:hypothetical protein